MRRGSGECCRAISLKCDWKSDQGVRQLKYAGERRQPTLLNSVNVIRAVAETGNPILDLDAGAELSLEEVAFVQEEDDLGPCEELERAKRLPQNEAVFETVHAAVLS